MSSLASWCSGFRPRRLHGLRSRSLSRMQTPRVNRLLRQSHPRGLSSLQRDRRGPNRLEYLRPLFRARASRWPDPSRFHSPASRPNRRRRPLRPTRPSRGCRPRPRCRQRKPWSRHQPSLRRQRRSLQSAQRGPRVRSSLRPRWTSHRTVRADQSVMPSSRLVPRRQRRPRKIGRRQSRRQVRPSQTPGQHCWR
jgi:hypothetical protein